jgi:PAS domain S-box-containing protein
MGKLMVVLEKLKLSSNLLIGFGGGLLIAILIGVNAIKSLNEMSEQTQAIYENELLGISHLKQANINLIYMGRSMRQMMLATDAEGREKQTEAWFRGIVESAPDGMLVVDEQGMIVLSNPKSEEVFGYEPGGLIGRNIDHLLPLDIRARHPAMREKFMSERQSRPMSSGLDLKGMRKDGVEFPIEVGLSRLPDVGGRERCVCASVRDITERKLAEDTIREAREIAEADDVDES